MARHKDVNWNLPEGKPIAGKPGHTLHENADINQALMMDLRDELKEANRINRELLQAQRQLLAIFQCRNFLDIPRKLERIAKNAAKIASNTEPEG